jgi:hypothetical protein
MPVARYDSELNGEYASGDSAAGSDRTTEENRASQKDGVRVAEARLKYNFLYK